jgi:hypothetical protein
MASRTLDEKEIVGKKLAHPPRRAQARRGGWASSRGIEDISMHQIARQAGVSCAIVNKRRVSSFHLLEESILYFNQRQKSRAVL